MLPGAGIAIGLATVAAAAPPTARTSLTAERIRIADHGAFVRAVVDFSGGRLRARDTQVWDADPLDGGAVVDVRHRRVHAAAPAVRAHGVRVRLTEGDDRIRIRTATVPNRFKYVARRQLHNRERVVVDLYRSAPPASAAEIPRGHDGCLAITSWSAHAGSIQVEGTAARVFASRFTLAVRNAQGVVVGRRAVTFGADGRWSRTLRYAAARAQAGTLEAVDLSERDSALVCLAQVRVPLAP
jgi:hypothetical protein